MYLGQWQACYEARPHRVFPEAARRWPKTSVDTEFRAVRAFPSSKVGCDVKHARLLRLISPDVGVVVAHVGVIRVALAGVAGCHFESNRKAFVPAYTPSATIMPVVSNPSTAMKMATILVCFLVGRKSP